MSIRDLLKWRVQEGMLQPLRPRAAGSAARRSLFVSEELWAVLQDEHADDAMEERLGHLEADLDHFAGGHKIDPKYLFLLYPAGDAVWEIRSVRHAPSIRVLGLFAAKNVFVATNHALREDLGGWQSREWRNVKRLARARWRGLFHPYDPLTSTNVNELISGAIDGKYFKN